MRPGFIPGLFCSAAFTSSRLHSHVTTAVYTHYTVQDLHAELAKFYYEGQEKPEF